MYAVGGHDGKKCLSSVEVYDQTTRRWMFLPEMKQCRMFPACVMLEGKLYVVGGQCRLGVPLDTAEVFDPALNQWRLVSSLGSKLGSPAAVTHRGKIHVLGKSESDSYDVHVYNPSHDAWSRVQTSLPYRMYAEAVMCGGAVYVLCGGSCSRRHGEKHSVYCLHPDTTPRWSVVDSQMPHPRSGFSATVVNGVVVVVGGHRGGRNYPQLTSLTPRRGRGNRFLI